MGKIVAVANDLASMPTREEFDELAAQANAGDPNAVARLRQLFDDHPEIWEQIGDLAKHAEVTLARGVSKGEVVMFESVRRMVKKLKRELGDKDATPLEKLAIQRVVICWLELQYAAAVFPIVTGKPTAADTFGVKQKDSAQRRFDAALKSLASLRKLLPKSKNNVPTKKKRTKSKGGQRPSLAKRMGWSIHDLMPSTS